MQWRKWRNWRKIASRWRFELDAKSGPLEAGDSGENGDSGEIGDFGKNRHACNGENGETGEKSPASGDLNWMPKVAPWRLAILAKMAILAKYSNCMPKEAPSKKIIKEVLITVRQQYLKKAQITCLIRGPNNCEATLIKYN